MMLEQITEAVARGYCTPENSHKTMDVTLCSAIAREVNKAVSDELAKWQQFASYCRSCALSGESDPVEFEDFKKV